MDAGEFVAVGIDLQDEDGEQLPDDGGLYIDDSPVPFSAEVEAISDVVVRGQMGARNCWKRDALARDERFLRESRIGTGRRSRTAANPGIHV